MPAACLRSAAGLAAVSRQLPPLHEQARLQSAGQVALEGGQPPLAGNASFAAQAAVACLLDEAEVDQFLEGPTGGVVSEIALGRGVTDGASYLAVVGAVVAGTDLDVDGARRS